MNITKERKMKILDFLSQECVITDAKGVTKKEVITELAALLARQKKLPSGDKVVQALLEREALGSTGIGQGIAIPHCKSDDAKEITAALGISKRGIAFDALDGEPVYLVFLLIAPRDSAGDHLKALAKISRLLKDKFFRQALREAKGSEDVVRIIKEEDEY